MVFVVLALAFAWSIDAGAPLLCACRPYPWGCAKNDFFGMPARVGNLGVCGGFAVSGEYLGRCDSGICSCTLHGCLPNCRAVGVFRQALATENDISAALHQIIANGVATVLIVLFLLASRKGFVVPGDLRGGDIDDSASQPFLPVGLFVVQFAVLFVIKACGVIASPHFVLASGLGFAIAALTVVAFSLFGGKVIKL